MNDLNDTENDAEQEADRDVVAEAARAEKVLLAANARVRALPVWLVDLDAPEAVLDRFTDAQRRWLRGIGWEAKAGQVAMLSNSDGSLAGAVLGLGGAARRREPFAGLLAGKLASELPDGVYQLANPPEDAEANALAHLAFALGSYRFSRYRTSDAAPRARLKLTKGLDLSAIVRLARAVYLGRDLINTPANDLGPAELEAATQRLAEHHGAKITVIRGDALLARGFPLIHAVGRASTRAPRLIDLAWRPRSGNRKRLLRVTVVGKGICFDTGGLNLKPGNSMALMKKDMGGAATALALADMIMAAQLPIALRVLLPVAENSVAGNAFRPGDVIRARNGTAVEIGNTDAEGRLVLADALAYAEEEDADYLFSFATLTGAARVALGPDLPPLYATHDDLAEALIEAGMRVADPLWRMPFWAPYDRQLNGKVGEVNHISGSSFAGSITAALFLKRFVRPERRYGHLDIFGWVPSESPARPRGGEPQGARAVFAMLERLAG